MSSERPKLRQSQLISTYGPGALLDLPNHAVIVAGLEHWSGRMESIQESRLLDNLKRRLNLETLSLQSPPTSDINEALDGFVSVWEFPEWFTVQYEQRSQYGRSRPLVHHRALINRKYQWTDAKQKKNSWPVVPVRFVKGCPNGHISDIDWPRLLHPAQPCAGQLWFDERGTTGDLSELYLRCDGCNKTLQLLLLQGSGEKGSLLGECKGERLWLGNASNEPCEGKEGKPHKNRLLIRHASNAYFPVTERAISIPDASEALKKAIDSVWDFLGEATELGDVRYERNKKAKVKQALEGFSDEEVWEAVSRRQKGQSTDERGLKEVEIEAFLSTKEVLGEDVPEGDFYAVRLPKPAVLSSVMKPIERVVLVHRLREVVAQVGFTRFEGLAEPVDKEVDLAVRLASLAREPKWLPAVENRGEGFFFSLDAKSVETWLERDSVRKRSEQLRRGMMKKESRDFDRDYILRSYMPYVLIHSLSHLLLTAVALECGYSAASIRERIYVQPDAYGLMLYTGTPDAEGTLGGLVEVGRRLEHHLEAALELGQLCSNDPVCAQHRPDSPHEGRFLHGAACHGCLLIAEPSCERRNELLDRALVVPTVDDEQSAFFSL